MHIRRRRAGVEVGTAGEVGVETAGEVGVETVAIENRNGCELCAGREPDDWPSTLYKHTGIFWSSSLTWI